MSGSSVQASVNFLLSKVFFNIDLSVSSLVIHFRSPLTLPTAQFDPL